MYFWYVNVDYSSHHLLDASRVFLPIIPEYGYF